MTPEEQVDAVTRGEGTGTDVDKALRSVWYEYILQGVRSGRPEEMKSALVRLLAAAREERPR